MTLDNALKLLSTSSLKFSSLTSWKDPYEKKVIEAKYIINNNKISYPIKGKFLATCFTEQYSCEAQWKAYSGNKRQPCVEIFFNKEKLLEKLDETGAYSYIGKVEYCATKVFSQKVSSCFNSNAAKKAFLSKAPMKPNNLKYTLRPIYIKRLSFAYENEWRLILTNEDIYDNDGIVNIPNLLDCIDGVVIGPCKDQTEYLSAKKKLENYIPSNHIHESYLRKVGKRKMTITL